MLLVAIEHPDWCYRAYQIAFPEPSSYCEGLEATLVRGTTPRGRVLGESGEPVAGAMVSFDKLADTPRIELPDGEVHSKAYVDYGFGPLKSVVTDARGDFQLPRIDPAAGLHRLSAIAPGFARTFATGDGILSEEEAARLGRDIAANWGSFKLRVNERPIIIRLEPEGRIRGNVTQDGRAVAGACVYATGYVSPPGGSNSHPEIFWQQALTDAAGAYVLQGLPPGGHAIRTFSGKNLGPVVMAKVTAGEILDGIDFALEKPAVVYGTVYNADTGKPVEARSGGVGFIPSGTSGMHSSVGIAEGGRYRIDDMHSGNWRFELQLLPRPSPSRTRGATRDARSRRGTPSGLLAQAAGTGIGRDPTHHQRERRPGQAP